MGRHEDAEAAFGILVERRGVVLEGEGRLGATGLLDASAEPWGGEGGRWFRSHFSTRSTGSVSVLAAEPVKGLNAHAVNGRDIALGFDPDCDFDNNGVTFKIATAAVPEPSALVLLGDGIIGLDFRHRTLRCRPIERSPVIAV